MSWLLVICWMGLVAFGAGMAFSEPVGRRAAGWVCLLVASMVAVVTAELWIKMLPGILGLGIINALITVWLRHPPTGPSEPVPRIRSAIILAILVACSVLASNIKPARLQTIHRAALLAFFISLVFAIALFPSLLGFGLMFVSLLVAWAWDRLWLNMPSPGE